MLGRQRLIVRRTRLVGAQAELWPDWRHFAFLTNRTDAIETVESEHRQHAVVELAIRDLKDQALAHFPSGKFLANAAWTVIAALSHNLLRWTTLIGLPDTVIPTARTLRRRLLNVPGRITSTARQVTLRMPARWPADTVPHRPQTAARTADPHLTASGRSRERSTPGLGLRAPKTGRPLTARRPQPAPTAPSTLTQTPPNPAPAARPINQPGVLADGGLRLSARPCGCAFTYRTSTASIPEHTTIVMGGYGQTGLRHRLPPRCASPAFADSRDESGTFSVGARRRAPWQGPVSWSGA
jgi:hypothetical protein